MWIGKRKLEDKPVIYILRDPRTGRVKYVGYTKNFASRIHYHYRPPRYTSNKTEGCSSYPWLSELADLGMLPISEIAETLTFDADWEERERFWIAYYKNQGEPLLNDTIGGLGNQRGSVPYMTPEGKRAWKAKISRTKKSAWKNKTPEEKEALLDNGARKGFKKMRPKVRDWKGRYSGAMDIPTETLFEI